MSKVIGFRGMTSEDAENLRSFQVSWRYDVYVFH